MVKQQFLAACAFSVLALASAAPAAAQLGGGAGAQDGSSGEAGIQPAAAQDDPAVRDIVVTGSLIRGTPEDAALPVDVIGADELIKQGQPTPVELLKNLPTSSGVLGDANQFDSRSQGAEGIATANLRGLSPQRTLVLLNNKRLTTSGNGVPAVDLNLLPQAAIGRIEVLKDGAAATYGSDAVAGVINFITRTDQQGFQGSGNYRFVKGSDGDVDVSLSYGHKGDNFRFLAAVGFLKRGELLVNDRDFAVQPFANNPQGGWSGGGNPANFIPIGPTGALIGGITPDSSCTALGGFIGARYAARPNGQCFTQYSPYDALVELEKRGQAYIDFEADVAPDTKFGVTLLYGRSTVPHFLTSPSYILTQSPSPVAFQTPAGTPATPFAAFGASGFFVPANNPGLIAYRAANPAQFPGAAATGNALFPTLLFRPYLAGGNPLFNGDTNQPGSSRGSRKSESFRVTADLTGRVTSAIDYNINVTYHDYFRQTTGFDSFGDRVQRALLGFGGPNCTGSTPGANGCQFLNPFGNGILVNPATGQTNPQGNPALANTAELASWIFVRSNTDVDTELFVAEGSVSGDTGVTLPGGSIKFALGGQYRYTWLETTYGPNSNLAQNPCRESPLNGNVSGVCAGGAAPNGALAFLGTQRNTTRKGGIYAFFGELQVPILDSLNAQLSARYEDYGGRTGSTFNPQVRARFQATNWLALRGGIGTTFRGPTLANISDDRVTALQLIGAAFKPVDVFGNPALQPETSTNISGGVILSSGGFSATVDYYRYKLKEAIISDPLSAMVATLYPSATTNACGTVPAAFLQRFTFTGTGCVGGPANIARVRTFLQNGPEQVAEGLDFVVNYRANNLFDRDIRLGIGGSATYTMKNSIGDVVVEGVTVQRAFDGVGLLNYQSALYPVPEWKGQAFVDFGIGPVDMRLQGNYIDGLQDQRSGLIPGFVATGPFVLNNDVGGRVLLQGANVGRFVTADFNVQVRIFRGLTLTGSVINLFDRDPPFARTDYNYEPFIGNPLGRNFKIGAAVQF